MEETLLQQILAVQKEMLATQRGMLAELRHLRQVLGRSAVAAQPTPTAQTAVTRPVTPAAQGTAAPQAAPAVPPQTVAPAQAAVPPRTATETQTPAAPAPAQTAPPQAATPPTPPLRPEPAPHSSGMLTMDELADLGGQFLDAGQRPKTRVKPIDVADLGASLLDEIKAKNRTKRDAFAEFDRLRRDR